MEPNSNSIGSRLRQARVAKNLTIPDVHEKAGISKGNLSTLETDKSKPSSEALIMLSELYDISTDWILKGEETKPHQIKEKDGVPNDVDRLPKVSNRELMRLFKTISLAWEQGDEETRGWIIVQLRRAFPEYTDKN